MQIFEAFFISPKTYDQLHSLHLRMCNWPQEMYDFLNPRRPRAHRQTGSPSITAWYLDLISQIVHSLPTTYVQVTILSITSISSNIGSFRATPLSLQQSLTEFPSVDIHCQVPLSEIPQSILVPAPRTLPCHRRCQGWRRQSPHRPQLVHRQFSFPWFDKLRLSVVQQSTLKDQYTSRNESIGSERKCAHSC